ncbi:hypothetical protein Droror1_Dr00024293 [Drosera rotundifolia]
MHLWLAEKNPLFICFMSTPLITSRYSLDGGTSGPPFRTYLAHCLDRAPGSPLHFPCRISRPLVAIQIAAKVINSRQYPVFIAIVIAISYSCLLFVVSSDMESENLFRFFSTKSAWKMRAE